MPLRVRHGSDELILTDEDALRSLYRRRQLQPCDLVWHPVRNLWMRLDAFLFIDAATLSGERAFPARNNHRGGAPPPPVR